MSRVEINLRGEGPKAVLRPMGGGPLASSPPHGALQINRKLLTSEKSLSFEMMRSLTGGGGALIEKQRNQSKLPPN